MGFGEYTIYVTTLLCGPAKLSPVLTLHRGPASYHPSRGRGEDGGANICTFVFGFVLSTYFGLVYDALVYSHQ